jgi:hypothetical protein
MGGGMSLTQAQKQMAMPIGGTIRNLYVTTGSTQAAGGSEVFTVFKNGVATALTISVPVNATAGTFSDTTDSFTVAAGDLLSMNIRNNAAAGTGAWVSAYSVSFQ